MAQGDYQQIAAALEPLDRLPAWITVDAPGWPPWPALYAEALVALGHFDQAEALLIPYEARAAACHQRWALVATARARGALEATRGHPESAEAAYQSGLEHPPDALSSPFDFALLEAAYGRFLRRTGRRADAVAQLNAARGRLVKLDAQPYLARCDHELDACGRTTAGRQQGPGTALTPQELAVARLVAAGRTNRQAAAEMVVSVKTIEYHLSNAYAKFAVTSRMQLAIALRRDLEGPLPESAGVETGRA
jgi:DNA-binding NarL/FixJ family response regulator